MLEPTNASSFNSTVPLQENWKYEVAVAEVENIIARIETGELELEEVFDSFAVAVEYLRQCEAFVQQRQQQVDLLIETLKDQPQERS